MRIEHTNPDVAKGWYLGPWNAEVTISVGYANEGVDLPHYHRRMTEIYCVARGTAEMRVSEESVTLHADDVIVVEPGEPHTFVASSPDYFHFVIQTPALQGDKAAEDKVLIAKPKSATGELRQS